MKALTYLRLHPASMGPRPLGRGNRAPWVVHMLDMEASMGPRPLGRGNDVVPASDHDASAWLQWGHGLSAVEKIVLGQSVRPSRPLQWGHGLSAVEMQHLHTKRPCCCFNGATSSRPWKRATRRHRDPIDMASMGPRPLGRGNEASTADVGSGPRSFNGATASRPWKIS